MSLPPNGWRARLPTPRGRLLFDAPLGAATWFRVGGPADALFLPADEADLAEFLAGTPAEVPVTVLGAASNTIVRDGGIEGVVIRLGRSFAEVEFDREAARLSAGAACPDATVARKAAEAGIAGLEFYAGIPGTIGGALFMNAGCYGEETAGRLAGARGVDRSGGIRNFAPEAFAHAYRHGGAPPGVVLTRASFQGRADAPEAIEMRLIAIAERRAATQPIREKTGGSTFKNPPGDSAWRLVDAAGWRGRRLDGAMMSPLHANFMINTDEATAANLEALGEARCGPT